MKLKCLIFFFGLAMIALATSSIDDEFKRAIRLGLTDRMEQLFRTGNVSPQLPNGDSYFHMIAEGNVVYAPSSLETLCQLGFDVNALNSDGHSALYIAALKGRAIFVKWLFNYGASVFNPMESDSVLGIACETGHLNVVKEILKQTKVKPGELRRSIMLRAAQSGSVALVKYLVEKMEAELDYNHWTFTLAGPQYLYFDNALHVAAAYGHVSLIRYLINDAGMNVNVLNQMKETPLKIALDKRKYGVVKILVEEFRAIDPTQLLIPAVENDNMEMFEWLLEQGAKVDEARSPSRSHYLIHYIVEANNMPLLKKLLSISNNTIDKCEDATVGTPAFLAAKRGYWDILLYLVKVADANPDLVFSNYENVYTVVAKARKVDLMRELLPFSTFGVNSGSPNALAIAEEQGDIEMAELLRENGAHPGGCMIM